MWESSEGTRPVFILKPHLFDQPVLEEDCAEAKSHAGNVVVQLTLKKLLQVCHW